MEKTRLRLIKSLIVGDFYLVDEVDRTVAIIPGGAPDSNCYARLFEHAPLMMRTLAVWVSLLETDHADEIASDHHGDGPDGCTYCKATIASKALIQEVQGNT